MRATEEGRERLAAHDESLTRSMAEHVEREASRPEPPRRSEATRGFLDRKAARSDPAPQDPQDASAGVA